MPLKDGLQLYFLLKTDEEELFAIIQERIKVKQLLYIQSIHPAGLSGLLQAVCNGCQYYIFAKKTLFVVKF